MKSRFLVLSADKREWCYDKPLTFLGHWCFHYGDKINLDHLDYNVVKPLNFDVKQAQKDQELVKENFSRLFPILVECLNTTHSVEYSNREWEIMIGSWFYRHIEVVLNRFNILNRCFKFNCISGVKLFTVDPSLVAPSDTRWAVRYYDADVWNNVIFGEIIKTTRPKTTIHEIKIDDTILYSQENDSKVKVSGLILRALLGILLKINIKSKYFIINSYLPRCFEILVNLLLNKRAGYWQTNFSTKRCSVNSQLRRSLFQRAKLKLNDEFSTITLNLAFVSFPICYLEGFNGLLNEVEQMPWPMKPKVIFTSNSFEFDEKFKVYTANKVKLGAKYYIGQHGNKYGTHQFPCPTFEEKICDKFLTWGWSRASQNYQPAFIFNLAYVKQSKGFENKLVLMQAPLDHNRRTWDVWSEHLKYFDEQLEFIDGLSADVYRALRIRLHPIHSLQNFYEYNRWKAINPNLGVEFDDKGIVEVLSEAKLTVFCYDSTGILEALALDKPIIAFWQHGLGHVLDHVKADYQELIEVGIFHLSPSSAFEHVNNIWGDVDGWWGRRDVQSARRVFTKKYAKRSTSPVFDLVRALRS